jgi:hypothetical protein
MNLGVATLDFLLQTQATMVHTWLDTLRGLKTMEEVLSHLPAGLQSHLKEPLILRSVVEMMFGTLVLWYYCQLLSWF